MAYSSDENNKSLIDRLYKRAQEEIGRVPAFILGGLSSVAFIVITQLPYPWATPFTKISMIISVAVFIYGSVIFITFYKDYKCNKELIEKLDYFNLPQLFEVKSERWTFDLRADGSAEITRNLHIRNVQKYDQDNLTIIHLYDIYDLTRPHIFLPQKLSISINGKQMPNKNIQNIMRQHSLCFYSDKSGKRPVKSIICGEKQPKRVVATDLINIPLYLKPDESACISIKFEQNGIFTNLKAGKIEWAGAVNQFFNSHLLEFTVRPPNGHELTLINTPRWSVHIMDRITGHRVDTSSLSKTNLPTDEGYIRWTIDKPKYNQLYRVRFKEKREENFEKPN